MRWIRLFCLIALVMNVGCREDADLLLYNARIYTVNKQSDIVSAMVIRNGRVIATGEEVNLRKKYRARRETDLKGKPVFPGFIDAHCHFYGYGLTLRQADLTGTA